MKTLIVYASKHRGTREIAEAIAAELERHGLEVVARSVERSVRLEAYDAVVIGSAIYEEAWLPEATAFLAEHVHELSDRPLWLFSSGTVGEGAWIGLPEGRDLPASLESLRRRIEPEGVAFFGGRLTAAMTSFDDRVRYPHLKRAEGDYRDWSAIRAWAARIAERLREIPPRPGRDRTLS